MKFEEVLPALREGKKITNSVIKNSGYKYIYYKDGAVFDDKGRYSFLASAEIVDNDDWKIVKEPKKVKLRDLTEEQYNKWFKNNCPKYDDYCRGCPFKKVKCVNREKKNDGWYLNKDLYSDKFLDQEIKIEEE